MSADGKRSKNGKKVSQINLSIFMKEDAGRTFLITSPNDKADAADSAVALIGELARATSGRMLVIDAGNGSATLPEALGFSSEKPESEAEGTQARMMSGPLRLGSMQLHFMRLLPAGDATGVNVSHLPHLLERVAQRFRFVLVISDAIYAGSTATDISAQVDAVIMVVRAEETRWEVARAAQERLKQAGATLAGCILSNRKYYTPDWIYNKL